MRLLVNLNKVKKEIKELLGKLVIIKVNIGRNKEEIFEGKIINMYPSVFTVETAKYNKSYSYSDVLTKDVVIKKI